jgi:16S rRNA (adenine1518-N6/adenine1519-N6)-dimethyltransferase
VALPSPKQLLDRFGLRPKNSFGQNFLSDAHLAGKIADLATPQPGLYVLEIGAGLGALTDQLLARGHWVTAIERDRDLVPALAQLFSEQLAGGRLTLVEDDAKTFDWQAAFEKMSTAAQHSDPPANPGEPRWVLAGNLPYQITGPLIERSVGLGRRIRLAVFLVQKEVADRMAASSGSKTYGALSVFVQAQFAVERALVIRSGAFYPQPRVDSAVVVLTPHAVPLSEETPTFRKVVKSAFGARRKTLRNAWKGLAPPEKLRQVAASCQIDLDRRGETLRVEEFANMASGIEKLGVE